MKISIITVCLNSERTIEQTIQSVIRQNYSDYEYIIIDGGSTDKTLEILDKYKENISIIVSEPDDGIYDAMNKGIDISTGDIVGIINSDDWYEPLALETVGKYFQESGAEVIYGRVNIYSENNKVKIQIPTNIEKLRYEMEIPHPATFVKRDVYIKHGTFQQKYKIAADYELMLRLYISGVRFACIDKALANFRHGGISELQAQKTAEETLKIAQKYLPYAPLRLKKNLKDIIINRYRAYCFDRILDEFSYLVGEVLHKKLGVSNEDNVAIFGAGEWGIKTYEALLKRNMTPMFLVDNDKKKWSQNGKGRNVLSPERLKTFKGVLLVLVNKFSTEILAQVEEVCNPEIYCITWEEITASCMLGEKFPTL